MTRGATLQIRPAEKEYEIRRRRGGRPKFVKSPAVSDPALRRKILDRVIDRIGKNPIPSGSPRFTRDELHERH